MFKFCGAGFLAIALSSTLPAQEPAKPPLDNVERAALAEQVSPSASSYQAVTPDALRKSCESSQCRKDVTIHLLKHDGTWFEQKSELRPPMIQGGLVTLYPGDKVRLVPVFEAGKFRAWQLAPDQASESTTVITIDFRQIEGKPDMTATISKSAGPAIKLSLGMFVLDGPDYPLKTSSCALKAGKWTSFENWGHPIYSLLVGSPRQLADSDPLSCN